MKLSTLYCIQSSFHSDLLLLTKHIPTKLPRLVLLSSIQLSRYAYIRSITKPFSYVAMFFPLWTQLLTGLYLWAISKITLPLILNEISFQLLSRLVRKRSVHLGFLQINVSSRSYSSFIHPLFFKQHSNGHFSFSIMLYLLLTFVLSTGLNTRILLTTDRRKHGFLKKGYICITTKCKRGHQPISSFNFAHKNIWYMGSPFIYLSNEYFFLSQPAYLWNLKSGYYSPLNFN